MAAVARMACELAPEVMVLEDVMRTTSLEQLQTYGLGELVEPTLSLKGSYRRQLSRTVRLLSLYWFRALIT